MNIYPHHGAPHWLSEEIKAALAQVAAPAKAPAMRAYMKERYPFLGIKSPQRRAASAAAIRGAKVLPVGVLLDEAHQLWPLPEREYQYAALDLLDKYRKRLEPRDLDELLALVRSKSWWDTVDALAVIIGSVVRRHRSEQTVMDACLVHPDLWTRRVAMLHQLGWRGDTDDTRLFSYARTLAPETDFFIRKAIGWALRDYARHAPDAVAAFLASEGVRLSPLTRREAAKHL